MDKQKAKSALVIIILYAVSIIIQFRDVFMSNMLLNNDFLITFVGIILGLSITVVTFLYTALDRLYQQIDKLYSNDHGGAKNVKEKLKKSYKELIEDTKLVFVLFIVTILLTLASSIPLFIRMPYNQIIQGINLGSLLCIILSTCDFFFGLLNILKLAIFEPLE